MVWLPLRLGLGLKVKVRVRVGVKVTWLTFMLSRCRSAAVRPGRELSSLAKLCLKIDIQMY